MYNILDFSSIKEKHGYKIGAIKIGYYLTFIIL